MSSKLPSSSRALSVSLILCLLTGAACGDGDPASTANNTSTPKPDMADLGVGDMSDMEVSDDMSVAPDADTIEDRDGDGYTSDVDCDDANIDVFPGADETCNGVDDDCDGSIDEDAVDAPTWYADVDGDGSGSETSTQQSCFKPAGHVAVDGDCDDTNPEVNPDATESCNGMDDNCDGQIDEPGAMGSIMVYPDEDLDGFGDERNVQMTCSAPLGFVTIGGDCDDAVPTTNPAAMEMCNNIDDNCNGQIDEIGAMGTMIFYRDADGDGFGDAQRSVEDCAPPTGYVTNSLDCEDRDPGVNPGASDLPDSFATDDNCDGIDGTLQDAIFVSANTGNDSANGRGVADASGAITFSPVATIEKGIELAVACGATPCAVYIAEGTYTSNQTLQLVPGVNLYGGFTSSWGHTRPVNAVVLTSTQSTAVLADGINQDTIIADLTIRGASLTAPSGQESIALLVTNTGTADRLTLLRASIEGGKGAPGASGAGGTQVGARSSGGNGGATGDCFSDAGGQGGNSGGGGGGGGSDNCPNACPLTGSDGISDGGNGNDGADGSNSSSSGSAASDRDGSFSGTDWTPATSSAGGDGSVGRGGGGGGGGGTKRIRSCFSCGTLLGGAGGAGGQGGKPGGGGQGGGQGGAAFSVVLVNSTVTFDSTGVVGGNGGKGGNGGSGASGERGFGGSGGAGRQSSKCGLINYYSGNGGRGGNGGSGGGGAGGAGGNGGPAIGVALVGTSSLQSSPTYTAGTAGAGGAGGAGGAHGINGSSAASGNDGLTGALSDSATY